jgi:hypothetical protein
MRPLLDAGSKEVEAAATQVGDHVRIKLAPLGVPVTVHGKLTMEHKCLISGYSIIYSIYV